MYQVGLIGYGAFGQALTRWLEPYCNFVIYDLKHYPDNSVDALQQPIIILAIPAQFLEEFLATNQSSLRKDALYIDVCSVKAEPVRAMLDCLPATAEIIATHPMFGPETAKHGVADQKIMIHPARVTSPTYQAFKTFLESLQLITIETTPEIHDHDMAFIMGLSHYIGRIMQELGIPDSPMSTRAYRDLLDMKNIQGNDSDDLFYSVVHNNAFSKGVLARFKQASQRVDDKFQL